jgi:hypothetical protein
MPTFFSWQKRKQDSGHKIMVGKSKRMSVTAGQDSLAVKISNSDPAYYEAKKDKYW